MDPYGPTPEPEPAAPAKSIDLQVLLGERPFLDTALEGRPEPRAAEHPTAVDLKQRDREAITRVRTSTMRARREWLDVLLRIGVGVQAGIWWYGLGSNHGFFSVGALVGALVGAGLYVLAIPLRWGPTACGLATIAGYIAVLQLCATVQPSDFFALVFTACVAGYMGGERKRAQVE